ncbi:anaerobic ribonucleoside-triphosphate reductase activating protein [Paenibacillus sp. ACRRX]|uniref:anaerobic ribonucleoside-triphosphate reductase activating protein n=1 Tax=Paenibacillus sp. ACRRX TaxID=2918206 RepID=UPI001EF565D8|nr:anaerobic ribonucleoside-triphosphate reductase activating protein [Paenibacillus sp. ACRRX]MCG7410316.1 anaerobic ribonucleoside-triphosphate reductase activating protein [Paenibacillus sp. ACRRX]
MSLYVMNIIHDSVVDGEGLRSVVFFSGCPHQCLGCHNPQSWALRGGTPMSVDEIADELLSNPITDVTLSGGELFVQAKEVKLLARKLRAAGKHIWAYTGYTLEQLQVSSRDKIELLREIDVLVDGPFELENKRPGLMYRGSDNQRIWQMKNGEPIGLIFP